MFSFLNSFRIIALLEGLSYILVLFIATPIKYFYHDDQYVQLFGMPHGLLFVAYIALAFMLKTDMKWSSKQFKYILLAAIIPFGTFYIDRLYLKPQKNG